MSSYRLRNSILDLLVRIENGGAYSHLLIHNEIRKRRLAEKDVTLFTEIVYGTIERKITLDYYLKPFIRTKKKLDAWVLMLLRMSVYQIVYLDKIPNYAIIHEAVEIAKQRGHKGIASFVNGVLRNLIRKGIPSTDIITDKIKKLSVETSHPEWLVRRWVQFYGYTITKEMCIANLQRKPISVRIQQLRVSREKAMDCLKKEGFQVKPSDFSKQGIIIEKGNILNSDLFKNGYLTIQDQTSMLVAEMLDVKPGMVVLDACSAPGGKATHIAEIMNNEGKIYAYDLHKNKINLIKEKQEQLKLSIIHANTIDARKLQEVHDQSFFDRIIVDAPCSGLGVLQGKPDVKYNKSEQDIIRLQSIQQEILESVAPLLKINGKIVYSTCTVDVTENEHVMKRFLKKNKAYQLDVSFFKELPNILKNSIGQTDYGLQIFPQTFQTDGFFLTRLIKVS